MTVPNSGQSPVIPHLMRNPLKTKPDSRGIAGQARNDGFINFWHNPKKFHR